MRSGAPGWRLPPAPRSRLTHFTLPGDRLRAAATVPSSTAADP
jgi:hypothetical protein